MEVKINREIRNYTENIFFGLSLRQFIFTILACGAAILSYYSFIEYLGVELTSWLCILFSFPFIAFGFIKYNGMTMEEFIIAFIVSEVLTPKELKFESQNIYYESIKSYLENKEKEELKNNDKIATKYSKTGKRRFFNT